MTRYLDDAATIRSILDANPIHPSGFIPIAVMEGPPAVLVYYHDDQMLTVEMRDDV